jgi:adenylate cyclase
MKNLILLVLLLFTLHDMCNAQDQNKIDSLQRALSKLEESKKLSQNKVLTISDSSLANLLYDISQCYWGNNPDKGNYFAHKSLALSEFIGFKKGIGYAYNSLGTICIYTGNYQSALDNHKKALTLLLEINDKIGISRSYNMLGLDYDGLGNFPEALRCNLVSLKIREELGDKRAIAGSLHNIGNVYYYMGNDSLALAYFLNAKKINIEIGNKPYLSNNIGMIGLVYKRMKNYSEALASNFASLKMFEEDGDKNGIGNANNNIGEIYEAQGNYPDALIRHFLAAETFKQIGDNDGLASAFINIGNVYSRQKKFSEAFIYTSKGLALARESEDLDLMKSAFNKLASIDSAMNNFKGAFENYKLYMRMNDSMFNIEKDKKLTSLQMTYDFDKKEAEVKSQQGKKDAVAAKEMQKQKLLRDSFLIGFAVVLLFAGIFLRQRNKISIKNKRNDELLLNILPAEVAEELKATGKAVAKQFDDVTVMFTDFKNFTHISEKLSPTELVNAIHACFKEFDNIISKYNVEKIKTIGDSYMCVGGLPITNKTNAEDVVNAAMEIQEYMNTPRETDILSNGEISPTGRFRGSVRIGIHTGSVVAGIVGVKKFAYDIWGDTVNIASRMESAGEEGRVNISFSTYKLVESKFKCIHRGKVRAKNKGEVDMYFVDRKFTKD